MLGLHAVASSSNPILDSGLDLFAVVPDSTLPCFVNSQLVTSFQLGFLIMKRVTAPCVLGNKLLNIQFAKYHIWNNKSEGFPNMVFSTETFNQ